MNRFGRAGLLAEATLRRAQRRVDNDRGPYSNSEEDQSAVQILILPQNRVESVGAPESSDRIHEEVYGNRRRRDEYRDCCVESRDVLLEEGYGTCDEEGVDRRYLVVKRVFDALWSVEYKDS